MAIAAGVLFVAVISGVWFTPERPNFAVSIASGPDGGVWKDLGADIERILSRQAEHPKIARVRVFETQGSLENLRLLQAASPDAPPGGIAGDGEKAVNFAFLQGDVPGDPSIRLVARFRDDMFQVVTRVDSGVHTIFDLVGKRVSVGAGNSGTRSVAEKVFNHFQIFYEFAAVEYLGFEASVKALKAGEIDAACFLAGAPNPAVRQLLADGTMKLVSLGDPDAPSSALRGLQAEYPFLLPASIPVSTYGKTPPRPVGTIAVATLLVTRRDVPEELVLDVTRSLFENGGRLLKEHVAAFNPESTITAGVAFPRHAGANAYYNRDAPHWVVRYTEILSYGATVLLMLGSTLVGVQRWYQQVRKDRIDKYYQKVETISERLTREDLSIADLKAIQDDLHQLRRRAFTELMAERLEANSSFVIFQDFLLAELSTVGEMLRDHAASVPGVTP